MKTNPRAVGRGKAKKRKKKKYSQRGSRKKSGKTRK